MIPPFDQVPITHSPAALAQWIERAAVSDVQGALPVAQRGKLIPFTERAPGSVAYGSQGLDSLMFNRVFIGGELGSADPRALGELLDRAAERAGGPSLIHLAEQERTPELLAVLRERAIAPYRRAWVKLMRTPGALPACRTELRVREAGLEDAASFAEIASSCLGLAPETRPLLAALPGRPHWHVYLACERGRPVATGALFVSSEIGYLGFAGTLPEARSRGAQRALLHKRIRVAFALGCRAVFSETGEEVPGEPNISFSNMIRLGMQPLERRENYAREGSRWR
jgi:GNAT superfamily N-acetyltransferase